MEMPKKRSNLIFDRIFLGLEKERLGEKYSGERDRRIDRHTDPSDKWSDR